MTDRKRPKWSRGRLSPYERVLERSVEGPRGCRTWIGSGVDGYGRIKVGGRAGRHQLVHRIAYEAIRGPIPEGLVIDHLCRNRACVNPWHMEAVTNRVNVLRGVGASARHARKTHCPHGHPYDMANTYLERRGSLVVRRCRTCKGWPLCKQ